jgi:hypothetical protein
MGISGHYWVVFRESKFMFLNEREIRHKKRILKIRRNLYSLYNFFLEVH